MKSGICYVILMAVLVFCFAPHLIGDATLGYILGNMILIGFYLDSKSRNSGDFLYSDSTLNAGQDSKVRHALVFGNTEVANSKAAIGL